MEMSFLKHCTLTRRLGLYDVHCLNFLRGDRVLIRSALGLKSKGRSFEPTVNHYFSSNNVRLLAHAFTGEDLQSE